MQLRRAFIRTAGRQHSTGLWCYPDAAAAARVAPEVLRAHKFSGAKAETLVRVARLAAEGSLVGDHYLAPGGSEEPGSPCGHLAHAGLESSLLAIKGIGPWTVEYVLLRGFGLPDRSLHGDSAVRAALQMALGSPDRLDAQTARSILARYTPYRSWAAAHLWASRRSGGE
jgi:DNA-3-methyladenine glycosylase II